MWPLESVAISIAKVLASTSRAMESASWQAKERGMYMDFCRFVERVTGLSSDVGVATT